MAVHVRTGLNYSGLWYGPQMERKVEQLAKRKAAIVKNGRQSLGRAAGLKSVATVETSPDAPESPPAARIKPAGLRTRPAAKAAPKAAPVAIPAVPEALSVHTLDSMRLAEMIRQTIHSADTNSYRFALNGIQFNLGADCITLAATDTRRLAVLREKCNVKCDPVPVVVLERKALKKLCSQLGKGRNRHSVEIRIAEKEARFTFPDRSVRVPLVEGLFPKWQDVIPKDSDVTFTATFKAGDMVAAMKTVIQWTDEEHRGAKFTFDDGLSAEAYTGNSSKCAVTCSGPFSATFDPRYVLEFVSRLPADTVIRFRAVDDSSAVIMEADALQYVIMPLGNG